MRMLLGAGVALASYLVSSVWKTNLDDQIKYYSDIMSKASNIETQISTFAMFQASSRYAVESIEVQKLEAILLRQLNTEHQSEPFDLGNSYNFQSDRALNRHQVLVKEFFDKLPPEVQSMGANPNIAELDPKTYENTTAKTIACITTDVYKNPLVGKKFSDAFADDYQKAAANFPHLEDYPKTFQDATHSQNIRLGVGYEAGAAILGVKPPRDNPFDDAEKNSFVSRRDWAMSCIATARDWTFDYFADLARFLRQAVYAKFIAPKEATRHRIEIAEIFLYVLSGLIALTGQSMTPNRIKSSD
jgi:hypothetical protein